MPLQPFPVEQENTIRLIAGQRSYRVVTPERMLVVNSKTFATDGDNRFEPLARIQVISPFTTANAQTGGLSPECQQYWVNDVFSRLAVWITSIRPTTSAVMPDFTELQIRQSFTGISTVRSTLNLGAGGGKALAAGDLLGVLVSDSGLASNEFEIWGRIPTSDVIPAQTNAVPFGIVFGVIIEAWPTTENDEILGKFVTAIP